MSAPRVLLLSGCPLLARLIGPAVARASTAADALTLAHRTRPDVVVIDLATTGRSGFVALERIMREVPTAVIAGGPPSLADEAIRAGAVEYVALRNDDNRPLPDDDVRAALRAQVAVAGRVRVIRTLVTRPVPRLVERRAVVIIGASTGGPDAVRAFLAHLGRDCSAGFVIVQHHPPGLTALLAEQLDRGPLRVRPAADGDAIAAGVALLAPGGRHLRLDAGGRVELSADAPVNGYRPAVDVTMLSAVERYGADAWGVILTGMGDDGVRGVAAVRRAGGRTFAQHGASCVVNGMPLRAIESGAVDHVAPPEGLARLVATELRMTTEGRAC